MSSWVRGLESEVRVSQDQGPGCLDRPRWWPCWISCFPDSLGLGLAQLCWNLKLCLLQGLATRDGQGSWPRSCFSTSPVLSYLSEICKANCRVPWLCFSLWKWEWYIAKGQGEGSEGREEEGEWRIVMKREAQSWKARQTLGSYGRSNLFLSPRLVDPTSLVNLPTPLSHCCHLSP